MQSKVGRAFRYQFQLTLHQLQVQIPFPCFIEFNWSRSDQKTSSPHKIQVKGSEQIIPINTQLTLSCTCFLKQSLDFVQKKSNISITLYINGQSRNGGSVFLNLSSIINPLNHKTSTTKEFDKVLQKSVLKNGRLKFSLKSIYVKQMMEQDLKQQSTSIASSNQKSLKSLNILGSLNSFNLSDFKDLEEGQPNNSNNYSLRSHKQSHSISTDKRRGKIVSQINDDYDLRNKQKQSLYKLQAQNTQLKMFANQHEKRINQLLSQRTALKQQYQYKINNLNQIISSSQKRINELTQHTTQSQQIQSKHNQQTTHLTQLMNTSKRQYHQQLSQLKRQNIQLQSIITKQELSFQNLQSCTNSIKFNQKTILNQLSSKSQYIQQLQMKIKSNDLETTNFHKQMQQTLKENIDLKLQIKITQQSNNTLADTKINQYKRKIISLQDGFKQCQQIINVLKKQIKDKNILLAVQQQKIMIFDKAINSKQQQIQQSNKLVLQKNNSIQQLQNKHKVSQSKIKSLKQSIRKYQQFVHEKQNQIKIMTKQLQKQKYNTTHLSNIISEKQSINLINISERNKQQEIINTLTFKIKQLQQNYHITNQQQISQLQTQNKNLSKTNQLLLQQLAKSKQESANQSTTKQNNWLQKIQLLQNQLKRRDNKISKLENQNRQLEEDNIKLNIKIMKELNQLQKKHTKIGKEGSSGNNSGMYQSNQFK